MSLFAQRAAQRAAQLARSALEGRVTKRALHSVVEVATEVAKSVVDSEVKAVLKGGEGPLSVAVSAIGNHNHKLLAANRHSSSKLESVLDKKVGIDLFEKANDMRATMHNTMSRGSTPIVLPRKQIEQILDMKNDVQGR